MGCLTDHVRQVTATEGDDFLDALSPTATDPDDSLGRRALERALTHLDRRGRAELPVPPGVK